MPVQVMHDTGCLGLRRCTLKDDRGVVQGGGGGSRFKLGEHITLWWVFITIAIAAKYAIL